jgi:hypothetical protein
VFVSPASSSDRRMSPKSVRYARSPLATRTFPGLTSRWTARGRALLEGVGDLRADRRRPFWRKRTLPFEEAPQILALDVAHRDPEFTVGFSAP